QTSTFLPQEPSRPPAVERDLGHKLEQLRSLIRSAMASLAADVDGADATGNIYCERIVRLHFENEELTKGLTANTLELYKRFLAQLLTVRRASERGLARTDLSERGNTGSTFPSFPPSGSCPHLSSRRSNLVMSPRPSCNHIFAADSGST